MSKGIKKDISLFQVIVILLLGIMIGITSFMTYEYIKLKDLSEKMRVDITTIVQSYNNLVTALQQNDVIKTTE